MTAQEFVEYLDKFLKYPILVEQEAVIVAALYEGKITKQTAGELMIKVAEHNTAKIKELFDMDMKEFMSKYAPEVDNE